jgi:putative addiction module component (TIGR02574 family)
MVRHGIDLDALSPQEQLDLLDQRVGRNPDLFPLTDEQRRELDARSEELDRDLAAGRPAGIPWEEVLTRIKSD